MQSNLGDNLNLHMNTTDILAPEVQGREYERLSKLPQSIKYTRFPSALLHRALYYELSRRLSLWQTLLEVFYYEPLFKSRCEVVGRNFELMGGIPLLMGAIRIRIGDNVKISGITTFVGSKMADDPVLEIGSGSVIGDETGIYTGRGVHIGAGVFIAGRALIVGDDGHPLDAVARSQNAPASPEDIKEVWIEDGAWIGDGAVILKGVRIGRGAVVQPQAVVTKSVPPYTIVLGNPAQVIQNLGKQT
jgi:acetyltransferase-like isoleucine patch superfamily enzyme